MVYAPRVIELVLPCARINLDEEHPLRNLLLVVEGFRKFGTLGEEEWTVLLPLVRVRLAFLCLISCEKTALNKESEYVWRCKQGHVRYLKVIARACSDSQFLELVRQL